ncbi:MAG: polysaccharide pyruvyl transferase CsaB [Clostridiales bacterium]|nr:polysaccharide pyruvyl transferase CsaB [Clostridiales bacterium]
MKVIHLISGGDTGGAKTHIHDLLAGISKNIDATLVCFMKGEFSDEAQALGINTVIMEGNPLKAAKKLKTMIKKDGYDLIHSHGARGNFMASLLRRPCGIPVVTTVHSDPKLDYLGRPAAALVYGGLNSYALKRADYLVGVSDAMKELLIDRGFSPNKIFTIYNGVDFSVQVKNPDRLSYLRSLGLSCGEDSVVVGIAARLDPVKDVQTLIKGFAKAAESCDKLRLVIAGEGGEKEKLMALAAELSVSDKICFAGWIDDIDSFFGALDINALTSLSETFPYAITEGARALLPTVSTRVGGVPMLINEGETGFLFAPRDYETLALRLKQLAQDKDLREKIGKAAYEKAKAEFSVEATTKTQINIYEEIIRRENLKKEGKRNGVIICGAYGMGNAGDDAILEAIVGEMRGIDPFIPITALSRRPRETRKKYYVDSVHMFNAPAFRREMKETKLYLSGGGSLIQNVTSRRSLWYYLYTIKAAKKLGNQVMMYGCGIGPLKDERDVPRVRKVLNSYVDVITLREGYSMAELGRLGVLKPKIMISSDPALTLSAASDDRVDAELKKYGLENEKGLVCFSIRNWEGFSQKAASFAKAADFVSEKLNLKPVFILINPQEDGEVTHSVMGLMKTEAAIISEPMEVSLTIGVLSRMRAMVSMRLHGLIFAASQGVPLVGVSYDPKVTAFLDSIGHELCIEFPDLETEKLEEMIEAAVLSRDGEKSWDIVEKLIKAEAVNSQMARQLLEK